MKRIFDLTFSIVGIIFVAPLLLICALLIFFFERPPVLFRQKRMTTHRKEFTIYKFRTIDSNFDKKGEGIQIKGSANSITKLGRFFRKYKLDELPQLFNILLGQMSFVGPRPELPRRLKYYSSELLENFKFKSGVTSPSSIMFSDEEYIMDHVANPEEFYIETLLPLKAKLNIHYGKKASLLSDIQVLLLTICPQLRPRVYNLIDDQELLSEIKSIKQKYSRANHRPDSSSKANTPI